MSFFKGARRLHPPRPPSVPPWDLEVLLRALSQPPFEPLASIDLKELSLKTAPLLTLASVRPRPGYVPKTLSTPFRTQTVLLSALSSESSTLRDADAQTSVCPVRAFWIYTLTVRSAFGNLTSFLCAMVVVRRAGPCQNRDVPTGLWTLSRLFIRAKVWNALCKLEPTLHGLSPPPGRGREVCLFRIYALHTAGLLRMPSADFTSWTFSLYSPKCCQWVTEQCFATSIHVCCCLAQYMLCAALFAIVVVYVLCCLSTVISVQPLTVLLLLLFCPLLSAAYVITDQICKFRIPGVPWV